MERPHPPISRASAAAHRRAVRRFAARDRVPASTTTSRTWFAVHQCPACGSANVRRSSIRGRESGAHAFRSPYRCEACRHRFWVVSRKARLGAAVAAMAAVTLVAFAAAWTLLPRYVVTTIDRDIEEWSAPPPFEHTGTALTPKGMAAAALGPTENLTAPVTSDRTMRGLLDAR